MADSLHEAGIRISGDASGAVDATKQLADEQKKLAEQTRKTNESAKSAAEESRRFVERMKEQAETVGKTRAEAERYRASQLQLTDAQKKSVDASIKQIEAYDKKQQSLAFLRRAALLATAALVGFAAVLATNVKASIDNADAINKLSQSYGISTQALSVYRHQMTLAGVSHQEFRQAMRTLSQNLSEAQSGIGQGAALFRVLGKDIESAARAGVSIEKIMPMIADRISSFADGQNKAALTTALLGARVGDLMIPALNQGSEGLRKASQEVEAFRNVIGPDFAERAEQFNDNVRRMGMLSDALALSIGERLVPEMNRLLEAYLKGAREGGTPRGIWKVFQEAFGTGTGSARLGQAGGEEAMLENAIAALRSRGVDASRPGLESQLLRSYVERLSDLRGSSESAALQGAMGGFATFKSPGSPAPSLPDPGAEAARRAAEQKHAEDLLKIRETVAKLDERGLDWAEQALSVEENHALVEAERLKYATDQRALQVQLDTTLNELAEHGLDWAEQALAVKEDTERLTRLQLEREREIGREQEEAGRRFAEPLRALDEQAARSAQAFETAVATGIMLGFRRGSGNLAQNLRRTIEDAIWTATLTPIATRIASPFGQVGQLLSGQGGSLAMSLGTSLATSRVGQSLGASRYVEDAAGNVTVQPTSGFQSSFASSIPFIGAAIAALAIGAKKETRGELDVLGPYGEKLFGQSYNQSLNPIGSYLRGQISRGDMFASALAPGLIRARGDTRRSGVFGGGLGAPNLLSTRWFDGGTAEGVEALAAQISAQEANLLRNLNLSPEQISRVNATIGTREYDFGVERTPWEQSQAFTQIQADRLNAISQALGRSIQELTQIMSMSAEQWAAAVDAMRAQLEAGERALGQHVRGLPGQLGITGLQGFLDTLATAEDQAPLDRVGAGLELYRRTRERALGGDLGAVLELPRVGGEVLGVGRDVYASGQGFQDIRSEISAGVGEVLARQEALSLDIMKDVPITILQASQNEVEEIRKQTATLVAQLEKLRTEFQRLTS